MRLGFVGVGAHAQRMAAVFRELGAKLVAFDCATAQQCTADWYYDGSSKYRTGHNNAWSHGSTKADFEHARQQRWQSMVTDQTIDAIVCCAPPAVTVAVAEACQPPAKICCLSKPLSLDNWPALAKKDDVGVLSSGMYVDLWRLYSPAWRALKSDLQDREIRAVHVDFYGNGPVRATHSGLLDYGPHALAFVLDLGLKPQLEWRIGEDDTFKGLHKQWVGTGTSCGIVTGNGGTSPIMYVRVDTTDGGQYIWHERDQMQTYEAVGAVLLQNWRDLALRNFCRAFLAGEPSDTLRISCEAMRILAAAEAMVECRT